MSDPNNSPRGKIPRIKPAIGSVLKNRAIIKLVTYLVLFISYSLAGRVISFLITDTLEQEIARNPIGFNTFVGFNINSSGAEFR